MNRAPFVTFLAVLSGIQLAYAECKCPAASPKEQKELATYVFNADVWDVDYDKAVKRKVITLDVTDTFKGQPDARIALSDAEEGKDCAMDFHEGESYLVYLRWQWGVELTSRCWGTKKLDQAGADGDTLGPGSAAKSTYYDKLQVLCMGRRDTPCCLSSVKAMREAGTLPKMETLCPEDMIPDRLRCDGSYVWCIPNTDAGRHNKP